MVTRPSHDTHLHSSHGRVFLDTIVTPPRRLAYSALLAHVHSSLSLVLSLSLSLSPVTVASVPVSRSRTFLLIGVSQYRLQYQFLCRLFSYQSSALFPSFLHFTLLFLPSFLRSVFLRHTRKPQGSGQHTMQVHRNTTHKTTNSETEARKHKTRAGPPLQRPTWLLATQSPSEARQSPGQRATYNHSDVWIATESTAASDPARQEGLGRAHYHHHQYHLHSSSRGYHMSTCHVFHYSTVLFKARAVWVLIC